MPQFHGLKRRAENVISDRALPLLGSYLRWLSAASSSLTGLDR